MGTPVTDLFGARAISPLSLHHHEQQCALNSHLLSCVELLPLWLAPEQDSLLQAALTPSAPFLWLWVENKTPHLLQ